jgi:hypothetical protein
MDPVEAAMQRVEAAARELRDAQLELAELTEPDAEHLAALIFRGQRPRLRAVESGTEAK